MKYVPIDPVSPDDAERAVKTDDPDSLSVIVLAVALHDSDSDWASKFCERLTTRWINNVRGNALLGFGQLARRFGRLEAARVPPLLEAGLTDKDSFVRGQSSDAADDVEFYLGWRLRRPVNT